MNSQAEGTEKPATAIRRAAMDLLARREHSFHELNRKLSTHFPEQDILPVLEKLRDEKLQSDQRYLEAYIRSRLMKGFGPLKIEAELYGKGLDSEQIRNGLYSDENDWLERCRQAMHKRFRSLDKANRNERAKCERFLQQRGYPYEIIRSALETETFS